MVQQEGIPEHPRVSDALARATLFALLDSEAIGVGLVRAPDWSHVLTNATYERLLVTSGSSPALGHLITEVPGQELAPVAMLARVVATGASSRTASVLVRKHTHLSLSFLRVRNVTAEDDGVLILVQDVTESVREHRISEIFASLAGAITAPHKEIAAIRANVARVVEAIHADAASIFLLDDRRRLHGALVGWDWTRTSFVASLDRWPNVSKAIADDVTCYLTAASATDAEAEWFERRNIAASICAPMTDDEGVLGVMFFDFERAPAAGSQLDHKLAKAVADDCARLVRRTALPGLE